MAIGSFPSIAQVLGNRVAFAIENMRQNLKDNDSIATQNLIAGIDFNTQIFGTRIEVNISMADYWKSVDQGQKPGHRPPLDKILKWMAFKGIDAKATIRQKKVIRRYKSGLKKKVKTLLLSINREQVARRIIEKIYRVGTKPNYFASDVINDEWQARVAQQLQEVGAKDIRFTLNVPTETRI